MLSAASKVVDLHGSRHIADLTTMFEKHIFHEYRRLRSIRLREGGRCYSSGSHCTAHGNWRCTYSECRFTTYRSSQDSFGTSSGRCLRSVLHHLSRLSKEMSIGWWDDLLLQLFQGQKYGERRGAAYGLAGIVKGAGISSITDFNILERLKTALEDKKRYEARQGAMFAIETFSATLERNFEPYIIELLPSLLASFGDASADVREATEDAAKVIMGNMSGYGVKRILPPCCLLWMRSSGERRKAQSSFSVLWRFVLRSSCRFLCRRSSQDSRVS